nr:uncharacterized protein LOC126529174 isoform X2 [Dermacentor andersoni]
MTVGDCRAFYGLYSSTVNTLCNQGVRPHEFIKERVKASGKMWQDIEASMKRMRELGLRAKSGIAYDVARSFEDVKIEFDGTRCHHDEKPYHEGTGQCPSQVPSSERT